MIMEHWLGGRNSLAQVIAMRSARKGQQKVKSYRKHLLRLSTTSAHVLESMNVERSLTDSSSLISRFPSSALVRYWSIINIPSSVSGYPSYAELVHSYVPTKSRDSALSIGRRTTAGALRTHCRQAEVPVDTNSNASRFGFVLCLTSCSS